MKTVPTEQFLGQTERGALARRENGDTTGAKEQTGDCGLQERG